MLKVLVLIAGNIYFKFNWTLVCWAKSSSLFGFFCGITNIIPYVGLILVELQQRLSDLSESNGWYFGYCSNCGYSILEGNFLQPYIMSKTTKLHPVTIISVYLFLDISLEL